MVTQEKLLTDIYTLLNGILSSSFPELVIVRKYQNAPKPANPKKDGLLLGYWVNTVLPKGQNDLLPPATVPSTGLVDFVWSGYHTFVLELDCEGTGSNSVLYELQASLRTEAGIAVLDSVGLSFVQIELPVQTTAGNLSGYYVEKSISKIELAFADTMVDQLSIISEASVETEFEL